MPALNEEDCIGPFIERMRAQLQSLGAFALPSWEIVVVDDGSTDRTRAIVEGYAREDARVRLISGPHRGKGAALRDGMLAAVGEWRFMADADLSMPPDNLPRFLDAALPPGRGAAIVVGSREAPGAQRIGEAWSRHAIGRVFNWVVRLLAVQGIHDTQCGFKLLSARFVDACFPRLRSNGFAFDVEMLSWARDGGWDVQEVGIEWHARGDSRVGLRRGASAFFDVARIGWRVGRQPYGALAYALAGIFAAAIAYDLFRLPVQASDSLGEILDASRSPSVRASFEGALGSAGYLRPLRIAQIKWLYDIADGRYWAVYRGLHAALAVCTVFLFTRALGVRSRTDLGAAALALVVLTGHHTFLGTVQEAFPINHFLEMVLASLLAVNLSLARPGWWVDAAAMLTFAAAALTLESGLLVWVVAVAAWACGLRGISVRGVAGTTLLLAAYFYVRFVVYPTGTPSIGERSTAYVFEVLERTEVERRFAGNPLPLYAYNVLASLGSVLAGEPQRGLFLRPERWLDGSALPRQYLAVIACGVTTALILWAMTTRLVERGWRTLEREDRVALVALPVIAANAAMCYAYTKDDVLSVAGAFYALAAYAAARHAIPAIGASRHRAAAAALVILALAASTAWSIRSAGVHHVLRSQAFRQRNDWAVLPARMRREGTWPDDEDRRRLILKLRADALAMRVPNPQLFPRWANEWWGE